MRGAWRDGGRRGWNYGGVLVVVRGPRQVHTVGECSCRILSDGFADLIDGKNSTFCRNF